MLAQIQSKDIFARKWNERFVAFGRKRRPITNDVANAIRTMPKWMCGVIEEARELMYHFHSQATELGLDDRDFPSEPPPGGAKKDRSTAAPQVNPFYSGMRLYLTADGFEDKLTTKHGDPFIGLSWQQLPLSKRKRINEVLSKLDKAKEDGS